MSTIRAGGLMSGLDTNALIEQLVALERMPIKSLQQRQNFLSTQKTLFSEIESALNSLKTSLGKMNTDGELLAHKASSSNSSALSATATGEAIAGTHAVQVLQTARAEQDRSVAFAASSSPIKAGTLTIAVQGEDPLNVAIEEGMSLADLAYAINRSGAQVTATVIDTGNEFYLTVYAKQSGHQPGTSADEALVLSETYTGAAGTELNLAQTVQARNAQVDFDGLVIERRSNLMTNIIPGLSLQLINDAGQPSVEVGVEADQAGLRANLQNFVDGYNKVVKLLNTQFQVGADASTGVLFGDGTLRGLMVRMQSLLTDRVPSSGGNFSTLAQVGLEFSSSGTLTIDEAAFDKAVASDYRGIAGLFTNQTDGMVARFEALVGDYTNSVDGIFKHRKAGIDQRHDTMGDQIARMELRVEAFETRLVKQFTNLELVIGQLKSQQNYLLSAFAAQG
jgi:flagellar hook-associated protein 2